jgi:hypothetical protein
LALSSPATLMPRAAATDWHVSPLRTVYVAPAQPVGVGEAAPDVRPLDAALNCARLVSPGRKLLGGTHDVIQAVVLAMGVTAKADFPQAEVNDVYVFAISGLDCRGI